ncbi:MAG: radical SAM family heme chaperone HemW [Dehalococcoidia bacterium]|nr:radical SAM family heme chaperone HemW [Dehalococcoidia bacterium]
MSYADRENTLPTYVNAVINEINLRAVAGAKISTIYIGGGTPSLLSTASIKRLLDALQHYYQIDQNVEITLEANPGTIDFAYLQALRAIGINRLSLGIQSLDESELMLLGRIHTATQAQTAIRQAQQAGFDNISLDFIYGIPGRQGKLWEAMLCDIPKLGMQHISLYGLTIEEGTLLHQRIECGEVETQDNDIAATEYEIASKVLEHAGLRQYEISNWALPGYESRHNTAYWLRTPYIGLGVASHSFLDEKRIANTSSLDEYLSYLAQDQLPPQTIEAIDHATALAESLILGLRLNQGVAADDIQAQFSIDLYSHFAQPIEECISLGLLEQYENILRLTSRGRLLGNEVFWRFLP